MISFLVGLALGSLSSWFVLCAFSNTAESESDKKFRAWRKRCKSYYTSKRYSMLD